MIIFLLTSGMATPICVGDLFGVARRAKTEACKTKTQGVAMKNYTEIEPLRGGLSRPPRLNF
jgi:hypothetical protein